MADLLQVVDELKTDEQWIRDYYADIWEVGRLLFREAKTAKGAKRRLREIKDGWEKELKKSKASPDDPGRKLLTEWCKITKSYWAGLFHCYSDARIPGTNNELERFIKDLKRLERYLSKSPSPGMRWVRNAPINAFFLNRRNLPGEQFLVKLNSGAVAATKAVLRAAAAKTSVLRGARRHFTRLLGEIVADWGRSDSDDQQAAA